ncbi:TRAP transporter small permease [Oceanobacillus longus]|uniref:TRAP transporter small permease n=1 Tax=Oceanobacillus longus TaxID=930120 RepID=A0ABV8H4J0_9BACI
MGLQVFMRYVMNNSLAWPEELSRYIFIWFTFIGVSYAVHKNAHLRIDILFNYVPDRVRKLFETISDIFFLGFSVVVVLGGINVFSSLLATMQTSPGLGLPMAFVYLSLPVGFVLTIIRLVQNIVNRYRGKEIEREEPII